jgi:hypothetical protein
MPPAATAPPVFLPVESTRDRRLHHRGHGPHLDRRVQRPELGWLRHRSSPPTMESQSRRRPTGTRPRPVTPVRRRRTRSRPRSITPQRRVRDRPGSQGLQQERSVGKEEVRQRADNRTVARAPRLPSSRRHQLAQGVPFGRTRTLDSLSWDLPALKIGVASDPPSAWAPKSSGTERALVGWAGTRGRSRWLVARSSSSRLFTPRAGGFET